MRIRNREGMIYSSGCRLEAREGGGNWDWDWNENDNEDENGCGLHDGE